MKAFASSIAEAVLGLAVLHRLGPCLYPCAVLQECQMVQGPHKDFKILLQIWLHRLGGSSSSDLCLMEEREEDTHLHTGRTKDWRYLVLNANSKSTSEVQIDKEDLGMDVACIHADLWIPAHLINSHVAPDTV